jgi:molybdenum cofactor biosynthesis enzyme MoaA
MENIDFEISENMEDNFGGYIEKSRLIIGDWRNERPTVCDGCRESRYDFWEIEPEIEILNISTKDGEDYCNAKCAYCNHFFFKPPRETLEKRGRDVIEMLEYAAKLRPGFRFHVAAAGGEISAAPFRDELFALLKKYGWPATFFTNAAVYCDSISRQMRDGVSDVVVTLDTTIPELYAKIKGVDCLGGTIENIRRYSGAAIDRRQIMLNLILLDDMHKSFDDIAGIVDFADTIGARLQLSCNAYKYTQPLPSETFELAIRWIDRALDRGIPLAIAYYNFNIQDADRIREHVGE